jgi:capsular exopolysaccharide synthesis family protein
MILAAAAGAAVWFLFPAKYTATAMLQISAAEPRMLTDRRDPTENSQDTAMYQRTQALLIKSRPVILAALKEGSVQQLGFVQQHDDPADWVERRLKAAFAEGTDVLRLSLSGYHPVELAALVNAIKDTYLRQVVDAERNQRLAKLTDLDKAQSAAQEKIRSQKDILIHLMDVLRTTDSQTVNHRQRLLIDEYSALTRELNSVESQVTVNETKVKTQEAELQSLKTVPVPEHLVSEDVERDPAVLRQRAELQAAEFLITNYDGFYEGLGGSQGRTKAEQALKTAKATLKKLRDNVRPEAVDRVRHKLVEEQEKKLRETRDQLEVVKRQAEKLRTKVTALNQDVDRLGARSVELEMRRSEVDEAERLLKAVREERERLHIELQSSKHRVTVLQSAEVPEASDVLGQGLRAGMTGLGMFVLGLFAVAFWEYRAGRIITTEQVASDLGLRVLGALPTVPRYPPLAKSSSGGERLLPLNSLVESIDGIRAQLLADNVSGPASRVLMIISATASEGKTMLASQLATSIARAGRRTLLLDCDLRRPSLGPLFDIGVTPGLSEVLRGEVELADSIQPVRGPRNLFILPAGKPDRQAIQALARQEMRTLLEKLRDQFEFVIIDSCPVLPVADALSISRLADGLLVSIRPAVSQVRQVTAACDRLQSLGVRMLGAVVNGDLYGASSYRELETRS